MTERAGLAGYPSPFRRGPFSRGGKRRAPGSAVINRTVEWGASTPAGEGGWRPYVEGDLYNAFEKLVSFDGWIGGTPAGYNASINAAGQLVFDALGAPHLQRLRVTAAGGNRYIVQINEVGGLRHVGAFSEIVSAAGPGNYAVERRDLYFEGCDRSTSWLDAKTATLPSGVTRGTDGSGYTFLTVGTSFTGTFGGYLFEDCALAVASGHTGFTISNLLFRSTPGLAKGSANGLIRGVAGAHVNLIEKISYDRPTTGFGGPVNLINCPHTSGTQVGSGIFSVDTIQDIVCPVIGSDVMVLKGSKNGLLTVRRAMCGIGGVLDAYASGAWDAGTTFNIGDTVTHPSNSSGVYVSRVNGNIGNVPFPSDTTYWELRDAHADSATVSASIAGVLFQNVIFDQQARTLNAKPDIIHGAVNNALRIVRNTGDTVLHNGVKAQNVICLREPDLDSYSLQIEDGGNANFNGRNEFDNVRLTRRGSASTAWASSTNYLYPGADKLTQWDGVRDAETGNTIANPAELIAGVPVNSVAPSISGSNAPGQTMTCTSTGTWTNFPTSFSYQWKAGGVDISGATSSTYVTDGSSTLTCAVTATNLWGNSSPAVSNAIVPATSDITFVGGKVVVVAGNSTNTATTLTGLTGGIGSDPLPGDLVVVMVAVGCITNRNPDITTAGYTKSAVTYANASAFDTALMVGHKIMGGTPDTDVTHTQTSASADSRIVIIQVWRNVDPTTPMDVALVAASGVDSTLINPASITPTTAGTKILAMGAASPGATPVSISAGYLSDVSSGLRTGTNGVIGLMGSVNWTSGAYDPAAFTVSPSATGNSWAAITMALRKKP